MKILIIEDDELIRLSIQNILRTTGAALFEARNGNEGLSIFKKERPDLVITDLLMPEKEGLETIKDIRAIDSKIKILAISGGGRTRNMIFLEFAKQIGANCTMSKPFKSSELLKAAKMLMGGP